METVCFRIKIKKGSIGDVRKWFNTIKMRETEVLESLTKENVFVESIFLETSDEGFLFDLLYENKRFGLCKSCSTAIYNSLRIN